jgi:hypothetical protein
MSYPFDKKARNNIQYICEQPSKKKVKAANYYKVEQILMELLQQEWAVLVNTGYLVFKNVTISTEDKT